MLNLEKCVMCQTSDRANGCLYCHLCAFKSAFASESWNTLAESMDDQNQRNYALTQKLAVAMDGLRMYADKDFWKTISDFAPAAIHDCGKGAVLTLQRIDLINAPLA